MKTVGVIVGEFGRGSQGLMNPEGERIADAPPRLFDEPAFNLHALLCFLIGALAGSVVGVVFALLALSWLVAP